MTYKIDHTTKAKAKVDLVKHRLIGYDGAYATKDKASLGISESNAVKEDWFTVINSGTYLLDVEAGVTIGQELTAGTNGKAEIAEKGDYVHAISRDTAKSGDVIEAEPTKYIKLGGK
jgi:hypothetical protein